MKTWFGLFGTILSVVVIHLIYTSPPVPVLDVFWFPFVVYKAVAGMVGACFYVVRQIWT